MKFTKPTITIFVLMFVLLVPCREARAQRFALSTNVVDWATFGTVNIEGAFGLNRGFSFHLGVEYNPWTFAKHVEGRQFQLRQTTVEGSIRWWPWYVFSGWWIGMDLRHTAYNIGGFLMDGLSQEGYATGGGFSGGYSLMLSTHWNIDFGLGFWAGSRSYRVYDCAFCGTLTDEGRKMFILPDAKVSFVFIF